MDSTDKYFRSLEFKSKEPNYSLIHRSITNFRLGSAVTYHRKNLVNMSNDWTDNLQNLDLYDDWKEYGIKEQYLNLEFKDPTLYRNYIVEDKELYLDLLSKMTKHYKTKHSIKLEYEY